MDGILRIKRGSALPVEVKSNISDVLLMRAAVNKHSAFDKHLVDGSKHYVLLYQDYCIVKYLPGFNSHLYYTSIRKSLGSLTTGFASTCARRRHMKVFMRLFCTVYCAMFLAFGISTFGN